MEISEADISFISSLEALLFVYGEPLSFTKVAKILNIDTARLQSLLPVVQTHYESPLRGIQVVIHNDSIQLVTKLTHAGLLANIVKQELHEPLTPAALETLSIIAYAKSISRSGIEYIRGVNSTFILRALLMRGLIERGEEIKGHSYEYALSLDCLKHLGLGRVEDLPDFERFQKLLADFRSKEASLTAQA